jgi:hypothetical protein
MYEIREGTFVEWCTLTEYYLENIKYKLKNTNGNSWLRIIQMSLSENFIRRFQD